MLVPDQGAAQQLAPAGLHPPFHDRVHARHPYSAEYYIDPRIVEDGVEQAGKLPVPVPDQQPGPAAGVFEVHDKVLRGLRHPPGGGVRGGAEDPDPAAGALDHREHIHACPGQGDRFQEVTRQQGVGLGAPEVRPRARSTPGCRIDPGFLEDLPDGGGCHPDAQNEEFAVDTAGIPSWSSRGRAAAPAAGRSARSAASPAAWAGSAQRGGARPDHGAGAAPCPDAPPAESCAAPPRTGRAATLPGTRDRLERTGSSRHRVGAPAP